MSIPHPSDAELEILQILWEVQPATVREVHQVLSTRKEVGYTTTLKQMQRMHEKKGLLIRNTEGKQHTYSSALPESRVRGSVLSKLAESAFKGSAMSLAMHALGQSEPSSEDLDALEQWLLTKRNQSDS